MGPNTKIEFADVDVCKAWQFSKYNVRKNFIFEMETLMGTHQVKETGGATSNDSRRSQRASHNKPIVSNRLLEEMILSLKLRHLWARIRSQDVRRVPFGRLPQS